MIRIFSSFDLSIFHSSYMIYFLLSLITLLPRFFYLIRMLRNLKFLLFKYMASFFNSLTSFNYSKNIDFVLTVTMILMLFLNLSSIFPFNFALTSHPSIILSFSGLFWGSIFTFSISKSFHRTVSHFVPEGSPTHLSPFLFIIEVVRNMIRPVTLIVRLMANILAGHLLISLLGGLVYVFPFRGVLLSLLNAVELFVCVIQSYIFFTLCSLYYSEV